MWTVASTTTQMLRGRIVVGGGVAMTASARVLSLPCEDAAKMVAPVWCSTWSTPTRRVTHKEAQPTVGLRCWVPDASVKKKMSVSLVWVGGQLLWVDRCIRGSLWRFWWWFVWVAVAVSRRSVFLG